ncbi:MAG: serine/threonine-protein kinase [Planctomycetota bacterium]|nr:serine/threonine-protein kinase [Planctomycetota bacterium]
MPDESGFSQFSMSDRIDIECGRLKKALCKGRQPRIADFLVEVIEPERSALLKELLVVDLAYRRQNGETPEIADYSTMFPDDMDIVSKVFGQQPDPETSNQSLTPIVDTISEAPQSGDVTLIQLPGVAADSLHPSRQRFGDYELLEEIARGGMGVVFRARQSKLNRIVALKMILSGQLAGSSEVQRFYAEAEAAARLDHPGIVPIYEVGQEGSQHFFSMGFVEGQSLAQLVKDGGPLLPRKAAELVCEITESVAFAHKRGVIHRDLKPANILLDNDGRSHVTDFGLAKQIEADSGLTATGQILGTPSYMPPEQAAGKSDDDVGTAADIYALGAILYCLLTGRPPFQAVSVMQTLNLVINQEPVAPRQLNPAIDRDTETICLKCLEKNPEKRYSSATELAAELQRFLNGEPIHSRRIGLLRRSWRWCRRNPLPSALIAASVAAILFLVAGLSYRQQLTTTRQVAEAAQEIADTQQYYSLVNKVRERSLDSQPGWTWKAQEELDQASVLKTRVVDPVELRSLTAHSLDSVDVRRVGVVGKGHHAAAVEFMPAGKRLAIAKTKGGLNCSVDVYDAATRELVATHSIATLLDNIGRLFTGDEKFQIVFQSMALSPDEKWIAIGTRHGAILCWETENALLQPSVWTAHEETVADLSFSPDSKILLSIGIGSKRLKRWSVTDDWNELPAIEVEAGDIALSPDGKWIAASADELKLFDSTTLQQRDGFSKCKSGYLAFSRDGRFLASGDYEIQVIDIASGEVCQQFDDPNYVGMIGLSPLFSLDGNYLVTTGDDETVRLWDVAAGRLVQTVVGSGRDMPLTAISPDGRLLAVAADDEIVLYELRLPEHQRVIAHHTEAVRAIDVSADGKSLACISEHAAAESIDRGSFSVWDIESGFQKRDFRMFGHRLKAIWLNENPCDVAWHPDSTSIVAAGSMIGPVLMQLSSDGKQRPFHIGSLDEKTVVVEEDQFLLPEGDEHVDLRDDPRASNGRAARISPTSPTGEIRVRIEQVDAQNFLHGFAIFAAVRVEVRANVGSAFVHGLYMPKKAVPRTVDVAMIPNDDYHLYQIDVFDKNFPFKTSSFDAFIKSVENSGNVEAIWIDRVMILPLQTFDAAGPARISSYAPLSITPDASRLWGVVEDDSIVSWSVPQLSFKSRWSNGMAKVTSGMTSIYSLVAGDDWLIAGTRVGEVFLVSSQTGQRDQVLAGPGGSVHSAALNKDQTLAAVGTDQGHIRIFALPTGRTVGDFPGHRRTVNALAFSARGRLLASGSADGEVRIWHRGKTVFEPVMTLRSISAPVVSLRFDADGSRLAILLKDQRAVRIWELGELRKQLAETGLDW